ncbi:acetyl-CoA synthetase-like protein [Favolaschia claudopus]|uniref:Acetyl-CoA synthetase-like protein n=1 Tax=Favolaschia claudopus TaxID=2862362 RepID=A0AAW0EH82_9AGAR
MLRTHLTVLETSASLYPSQHVFKLPRSDSSSHGQDWSPVTYRQFLNDVESFARHWSSTLAQSRIAVGSVVGLWIGGYTYTDVLNIYGMSRAGFIPQLFSLRLPSPEVIFELLHKANAKALVYERDFASVLRDCPVPAYLARSTEDIEVPGHHLPDLPPKKPEDIAFYFHTSGSSGGSPKLVPCSHRWLDATVMKSYQTCIPKNADRQDVTVWMGSMCHIGQTFMLIGSLQHGTCVIQPTQISFDSLELFAMVQRCELNRLNQFAAFLCNHLRASRQNPKLLSLLTSFDEVLYSGMPLAREEEEWAYRNGIKIRNLFGSTEAGATLLSVGGTEANAALLQPLAGTAYRFQPVGGEAGATATHQSTARLLEFIILAESGDCPHISLRQADGHFHTGDLFQEVAPGRYISCGRDDDWIKSENSLRCDTKSIEDHTRMMCAGLVAECIVVGAGRPSPVLFVEPNTDMDSEKLKKEIIRKTRQFHSRRYLHERISTTNRIVVVPPKTLPRTLTKGNIRRKAVEEAYKNLLDELYAS